jgi:HEPN/RES N-terminal domain 1
MPDQHVCPEHSQDAYLARHLRDLVDSDDSHAAQPCSFCGSMGTVPLAELADVLEAGIRRYYLTAADAGVPWDNEDGWMSATDDTRDVLWNLDPALDDDVGEAASVRQRRLHGLGAAARPRADAPRAPLAGVGRVPPGTPVARDGLVVEWEPVTETIDRALVTTTGYEVIVTKEDHDDPHGFSRPVYDVHVPAALDSLSVPAEFLEPDTVYELEVLALERSGNQTISVGFFITD